MLDISPWAEATKDLFLRNPIAQRMPRKFKINFSGCATDCGQAMFNDVGVVAVNRPLPDGTVEPGFRVFMAGGLGANPHPAIALEEFTSRDDLLATIESILRVQDHHGNRDNKLRARLKWLVDTMGADELRERIIKERKFLPASATYPGGVPAIVDEQGDAPAGMGTDDHRRRRAHRFRRHAGAVRGPHPAPAVGHRQRRARPGQRHRERVRVLPPRRHHHRPVPRRSPQHPA